MLVARKVDSSQANGPGCRSVVWLQGCEAKCAGCCNPELQPMFSNAAKAISSKNIAEWFVNNLEQDNSLRGLTLSGGEPLHPRHIDEVLDFLSECRLQASRKFDVMVFTGFQVLPKNLSNIDMLIAGPYMIELNNKNGIVSSNNQNIIRMTDAFADISDDVLINGKRIIEVRIQDGVVMTTGLSSIDESMKIIGQKS